MGNYAKLLGKHRAIAISSIRRRPLDVLLLWRLEPENRSARLWRCEKPVRAMPLSDGLLG